MSFAVIKLSIVEKWREGKADNMLGPSSKTKELPTWPPNGLLTFAAQLP